MSGKGDITVWINSPGGDCIAAAQIFNMLKAYDGKVVIKIDGIAASAASVIAMAGDEVLISEVGMLMIHNPATMAMGDHNEMQKAIDMLDEVKESIINAYASKTGLTRAKLSHLMESETWMNANMALELGFVDGIIERNALPPTPKEDSPDEDEEQNKDDESIEKEKKNSQTSMLFSRKATNNALLNKLERHYRPKTPQGVQAEIPEATNNGRSADEIRERLDLMSKFL